MPGKHKPRITPMPELPELEIRTGNQVLRRLVLQYEAQVEGVSIDCRRAS